MNTNGDVKKLEIPERVSEVRKKFWDLSVSRVGIMHDHRARPAGGVVNLTRRCYNTKGIVYEQRKWQNNDAEEPAWPGFHGQRALHLCDDIDTQDEESLRKSCGPLHCCR